MYAFEYHKATDAQTAVTALKTHPTANTSAAARACWRR